MNEGEEHRTSQSTDDALGAMDDPAYPIRFFIEEPSGNVYRAEASSNTRIGEVATDFFEERNWPTRDRAGRPQRAVVERVDPDNPERTERLRADQTLRQAGVRDDDTLRIQPESVAGLYNPHERLRALVLDYREVQALVAEDPDNIAIVDKDSEYNPTRYEIAFHYTGVKMGDHGPELTTDHRVEITLPADYPVVAPTVRWHTPIFHPNIDRRTGHVCLGVLEERYMPGVGLSYIVRMLRDIVCYRNYDLHGVLDAEAREWAISAEGQRTIVEELGGIPQEQPLDVLLEWARQSQRQRLTFTRVPRGQQEG